MLTLNNIYEFIDLYDELKGELRKAIYNYNQKRRTMLESPNPGIAYILPSIGGGRSREIIQLETLLAQLSQEYRLDEELTFEHTKLIYDVAKTLQETNATRGVLDYIIPGVYTYRQNNLSNMILIDLLAKLESELQVILQTNLIVSNLQTTAEIIRTTGVRQNQDALESISNIKNSDYVLYEDVRFVQDIIINLPIEKTIPSEFTALNHNNGYFYDPQSKEFLALALQTDVICVPVASQHTYQICLPNTFADLLAVKKVNKKSVLNAATSQWDSNRAFQIRGIDLLEQLTAPVQESANSFRM